MSAKSSVPAGRLQPSTSPPVISEQPHALLDGVVTAAPSLGSISGLRPGGSTEPFTGRSVDTLTSNPYGQLGVSAFTEGVYTEDGHINPAFSEAVTESTGRMMTDMLGEETMEKLEQRYAKAVDIVTEIEMSAGQIAMAGQSLDHLVAGQQEEEPLEMREVVVDETEEPAADVPDGDDMLDAFSTEMVEPEADTVATDLYELDAEQLGQMATATAGYLPQMEVPDGGADLGDADTDGCCCCCGDDDLCGCGDMCDMCGCGGCCGCSGLCDCGDCGDCFGCGDCIGCGDCPTDCCSSDCSIM